MSETTAPVYVVDDDVSVCESLGSLIRSAAARGGLCFRAGVPRQAEDRGAGLSGAGCEAAGLSGLDLQQELAKADIEIPVIFLTGHADVAMSVRAMKAGALEFFTKPFDDEALLEAIRQGIGRSRKTPNGAPDGALEARSCASRTPGSPRRRARAVPSSAKDPRLRRLLGTVSRVAPKDITLLIRGETGTGKELIASLVHASSRRRRVPWCASIAPRSGRSGRGRVVRPRARRVHRRRPGAPRFFAQADGGTLVLDEVGELPLPCKRSCCARCRMARSNRSARPASSGSTACRGMYPPRSRQRGARRPLPRGPLLPARRPRVGWAAASRAPRRHPGARRRIRPSARGAVRNGKASGYRPKLLDALQHMDWPGTFSRHCSEVGSIASQRHRR